MFLCFMAHQEEEKKASGRKSPSPYPLSSPHSLSASEIGTKAPHELRPALQVRTLQAQESYLTCTDINSIFLFVECSKYWDLPVLCLMAHKSIVKRKGCHLFLHSLFLSLRTSLSHTCLFLWPCLHTSPTHLPQEFLENPGNGNDTRNYEEPQWWPCQALQIVKKTIPGTSYHCIDRPTRCLPAHWPQTT